MFAGTLSEQNYQESMMPRLLKIFLCWMAIAGLPALAQAADDGPQGRLVSAGWLAQRLGRPDLLVLDASPGALHRKSHIPGAVNADLYAYSQAEVTPAQIEQRLRSWGIRPDQQLVIYDQGATWIATRLFWDLLHRGVPAQQLYILDGGMAKWSALGHALTQEATPAPPAGSISLGGPRQDVRVRLPEFLAATGDPVHHVMLEALDPSYYFGGAAFFDRAGHVPHATLMPAGDFFNADKTFKSPPELERMLRHLGVRPEQQIHTYCGGGGAAAVPFFALKFILNYPQVRLFQESQMGWLQDPRELPLWSYADPHLLRDANWVKAWSSPMLKAFGLSKTSIVDVRSADQFKLGHVPQALNLPAAQLTEQLRSPEKLAALLGHAGLDPRHEVVLVSEGGLNEQLALALLMLDGQGQQKVSLLLDGIERWAERGHEVARPGAKAAPAPELAYAPKPRQGPLLTALARSQGPRVFLASGPQPPAQAPDGPMLHLPYAQFLNADASPKPAKEIWNLLEKAGLPRYTEIVLLGDQPGAAAVNYVILKLMGFRDVKVWLRG
ncbi:rhodanese-like domain-containing protein [Paucibacter soli]|uniref:rhodanese-like domain-containing protein n=1 Tax=Paucibacter soli TaxID=3133433 RepID=UPI0030949F4E